MGMAAATTAVVICPPTCLHATCDVTQPSIESEPATPSPTMFLRDPDALDRQTPRDDHDVLAFGIPPEGIPKCPEADAPPGCGHRLVQPRVLPTIERLHLPRADLGGSERRG